MKPIVMAALLATGSCLALSAPTARAQTAETQFNIPAQRLADALRAYSEATGRDVIAASQLLEGRRSSAVHGRLSPDEALARLLARTGLVAEHVVDSWVLQLENDPAPLGVPANTGSETIVVTGSRIRGAGPVGSPVVTLDRAAIEKSGYATVQQLLQSLPQAFMGGSNETTTGVTTRNGTGNDATLGSSINLRGLGTNSTLVLIDGARPALGGTGGVLADISLLPMSAVERIEILTDGASAIYGADAVAGVVNVRLRNRFEGAETMLRIGTADGDMTHVQFSQIVGKTWDRGRFVLAYQFSNRGALRASERAFAREDLRLLGGPDYRSIYANPGTILAADGRIFGIPANQDGRDLTPGELLSGVQNLRDNRVDSDLLPRQRVHSLYSAAEFELTDNLTFRANLLGAQRKFRRDGNVTSFRTARVPVTNPFYVDPIGTGEPVQVLYSFVNDIGPQIDDGRVRAISTSAGLEMALDGWRVQLGGSHGVQKGKARTRNIVNSARLALALADTDPATAFNVFGDGTANNPTTIDYIRGSITTIDDFKTWSAALRGDGPLFRLPAGDVRLAVGAEYRREAFDYYRILDSNTLTPVAGPYPGFPGPRHVRSIYAEMLLPLFGADNARPGLRRLDLTVAGRIEDYNQFGRTENPKFSARWEPLEGLAFRGSYGTSFRAPQFDELVGPAVSVYSTLSVPDPASPTGETNVLALFGYAPNIQPEKAKSWTAGFDITPLSMSGLKASVTYFDVDYRDRIGTLAEDYFRFLTDRATFGGVVTDRPPLDLVQYYYDQPTFSNPINIAAAEVAAILDGRTRNLAREHQKGIDFDIGLAPEVAGGTLDLGVSGTHIFSIVKQLSPGSATSDFVGLYASPVKWRLRGRLGWAKGGFSARR
ncbi:TonB-dependent receptor [Sphingopyxis sp. 113P3]|uniref:TonB-dependent receptor n=1 Tax=Sphingopyxis sp. (strain 113P3) TaxID=292913 RepID=UPI000AD55904|nr:TonB-dependent receptor [Sphingopyxis sp. 113P3]